MTNTLETALSTGDMNAVVQAIPYARTIGMAVHHADKKCFVLPSLDTNVGNPTLPALHGGCIGGFMENSAIVSVIFEQKTLSIPKVINFSLDYLKPGRLKTTYAQCHIVKQGRKVANVAITAFQDDISKPIAKARVHLLL